MTIISALHGYDKDFQPVCTTLGEQTTVWGRKNRGLRQFFSWTGTCCAIKEWNGKMYAEIETYQGRRVYGPIDTSAVKYTEEEANPKSSVWGKQWWEDEKYAK